MVRRKRALAGGLEAWIWALATLPDGLYVTLSKVSDLSRLPHAVEWTRP